MKPRTTPDDSSFVTLQISAMARDTFIISGKATDYPISPPQLYEKRRKDSQYGYFLSLFSLFHTHTFASGNKVEDLILRAGKLLVIYICNSMS
jgi:hypothetical protein